MHRVRNSLTRILLLLVAVLALSVCVFAAERTAENAEQFYQAMSEGLSGLEEEFSITVTGSFAHRFYWINDEWAIEQVLEMAAYLPNEDGTGGDVSMMNIESIDCRQVDNTILFSVEYLLDAEQLSWVDAQLDPILDELQISEESDYMKIKKIYQYVGTHFLYDDTLSKFTDYDGLTTGSMVCQGYALLTYKLLWRAGVPARILRGVSSGEPHGWNIVKLDGLWYNLDTTWDAADNASGAMYWRYFLKNDEDFYDHVRDESFDAARFRTICPMAEESFSVPSVEITIDGVLYSGLTIRNGISVQLGTILMPESDTPIKWASTDSSVASVDENGLLSSLTPGRINITATAEDTNYIPGVFPVTAVDMRSCSKWAEEELTSYYLRTYYPAELCSDYQQPITRAEFARLLEILISSLPQENNPYRYPGRFTDITDSRYWFSIIYCTAREIFSGTSVSTFDPDGTLTREQAAKLLCTLLDFFRVADPASGESIAFTDADEISSWAADYVDRAVRNGLMQGDGERFSPKAPISREMAAVLLERAYVQFFLPQAAQNAA